MLQTLPVFAPATATAAFAEWVPGAVWLRFSRTSRRPPFAECVPGAVAAFLTHSTGAH